VATEWETVGGEIVEDLTATRMRQPARRDAQLARRRTAAAPRPRKFFARLFGVLAAVGLFISVALVAPVTTMSELAAPGGVLIAVGRVSAMAGTYLMLVTLLLIARMPPIERALGQDKLVRLHRRLGPWVIALVPPTWWQ